MDDLAALRLQIEWGADEALLDVPSDRFAPLPPAPRQHQPSLSPAAPRQVAAFARVAAATATTPVANDAPDLAALHQALDAFHTHPLRGTASNTVAPSGNPDAGLLVIGDAPGAEDDRSGHAFSGAPGARLDRILATAGLGRDTLLLAMLVPWRPPGGRPASEAEIASCLPFLHRLIALARPRHVILLGAGPLRAVGGDPAATLRRVRGRWIPATIPGLDTPVPALAMLPPDLWLSNAANKQSTWSDLLTINEALSPQP